MFIASRANMGGPLSGPDPAKLMFDQLVHLK